MKAFSQRVIPLALLTLAACSDAPTGPNQLDSLRLEPDASIIAVGDTTRVVISGTAPGGEPATPRLRLRSLDPGVAMVNGAGVVVGVGQGVARLIGEVGGAADTARVTVIPGRYNVQAGEGKQCTDPDYREGRVVAVSNHAIVVADPENPEGGFTPEEYREIAQTFDQVIHPIVTGYFGEPFDIDGNGKVIIYYTRAVNELTPAGSAGYVGGFFHTRDLYPRQNRAGLSACATSNEAEIFYLMVADPDGRINRNKRSKALVRQATLSTIAHEYQHLINASRRLFINKAPDFEENWLNEGLSHIAEELVFYQVSGLSPRINITRQLINSSPLRSNAFSDYQQFNFGRLDWYLKLTESHSAFSNQVRLGDRGAVWYFLRYLADRLELDENELWHQLVNSTTAGITNLQEAIGQDPFLLYRDWAVALFTDDNVSNTGPVYQQPSWNHRTFIWPLYPVTMIPGISENRVLHPGGSTYLEFAVAAGDAAELRVGPAAEGTPPPGACTGQTQHLDLGIGEVHTTPEPVGSSAICLAPGGTKREYVLVATNIAASGGALATLFRGYGITSHSGAGDTVARVSGITPTIEPGDAPLPDYSIDARIRRFEESLSRGSTGAAPTTVTAQSMPGEGSLYISVVRVR